MSRLMRAVMLSAIIFLTACSGKGLDAKMNLESSAAVDKLYGDAVEAGTAEQKAVLTDMLPLFVLYRKLNPQENPVVLADKTLMSLYQDRGRIEKMTVREFLNWSLIEEKGTAEKDLGVVQNFLKTPAMILKSVALSVVSFDNNAPVLEGVMTFTSSHSDKDYNVEYSDFGLGLVIGGERQRETIRFNEVPFSPELDAANGQQEIPFKHRFVDTPSLTQLAQRAIDSGDYTTLQWFLAGEVRVQSDHGQILVSPENEKWLIEKIATCERRLQVLKL